MAKPIPKNSERPFEIDEMFFSVTDMKGLITYGNEVFLRVSGYEAGEILRKPHNIVRHPDMPKAVFKLFWSKLLSGNPIGAYVKNMAADGSYYWVFAFAFPVENGFLSIRFKPTSKIFAKVQAVYQNVLQDEKLNGVESASKFLLEELHQAGFPSYDSFMVTAAIEELQCRDELVQNQKLSQTIAEATMSAASQRTKSATLGLNTAFSKISEFKKSSELFTSSTLSMQEGFRILHTVAVNMILTAAKHGAKTATLGVVSTEFSRISEQIEKRLNEFAEFMVQLSNVIETCSLQLAVLKTEMLMVDFFVKEMVSNQADPEHAAEAMGENRKIFTNLFDQSASSFVFNIQALSKNLGTVFEQIARIRSLISGLEVIRQIGAIEAARAEDTKASFANYLEEMDQFNLRLRKSMTEINTGSESLVESFATAESVVRDLATSVNDIFELASQKAAA